MRRTPIIVLFLIAAGIMLAQLQSTLTMAFAVQGAADHVAIVSGMAGEPYRFRILTPHMIETFAPDHEPDTLHNMYAAAHTLFLPLALVCLFAWLQRTHSTTRAMIGCSLVVFYLPLMFLNDYLLGLWSIVELTLFCAALLALDRPRVFLVLVVVATLNRETAVLLPLAWVCWHGRKRAAWGVLCFVAWGMVYGVLRIVIGGAFPVVPLADGFARNIGANWSKVVLMWSLVTPLAAAVVIGSLSADRRHRRLLIAALVYLPLYLVFGLWHEVRLLLAIVPFVLPSALAAFEGEEKRINNVEHSTLAR